MSDSVKFCQTKGDLYLLLGEKGIGYKYFDSARFVCENRVQSEPDNATYRMDLATAYAGLGRKEDAIREGELAVDLMPVSKDALEGTNMLNLMAIVYTMTGDYDKAIDLLEYLLENPSMLQAAVLRLHPQWDPLRDNPRFRALLEKYGKLYKS